MKFINSCKHTVYIYKYIYKLYYILLHKTSDGTVNTEIMIDWRITDYQLGIVFVVILSIGLRTNPLNNECLIIKTKWFQFRPSFVR